MWPETPYTKEVSQDGKRLFGLKKSVRGRGGAERGQTKRKRAHLGKLNLHQGAGGLGTVAPSVEKLKEKRIEQRKKGKGCSPSWSLYKGRLPGGAYPGEAIRGGGSFKKH